MIKAKTTTGDMVLGLSDENIKRLKDGQPIKFNMKEVIGIDADCIILYGETERHIMRDLEIGTSTKIHT